MKGRALRVGIGVAALCGCSGGAATTSDAGADATGADAASDAATGADVADAKGSPSCPTPAPLDEFNPTYHPATPLNQGVCSPAFLTAFYQDCVVSGATSTSCSNWGSNGDFVHQRCAACLATPSSEANWGPIIVYPDGVLDLNLAGCIQQLDPTAAACATTMQASYDCEHAACDVPCPVTDRNSYTQWQKCATAADQTVCKTYVEGSCAAAEFDGGAATGCFPWEGVGASFGAYYDVLSALFCGSADAGAADGGAEGGDGGADGAADGGEGGADGAAD
jgi:hypothetical protein